jgi:hypothetical protein
MDWLTELINAQTQREHADDQTVAKLEKMDLPAASDMTNVIPINRRIQGRKEVDPKYDPVGLKRAFWWRR